MPGFSLVIPFHLLRVLRFIPCCSLSSVSSLSPPCPGFRGPGWPRLAPPGPAPHPQCLTAPFASTIQDGRRAHCTVTTATHFFRSFSIWFNYRHFLFYDWIFFFCFKLNLLSIIISYFFDPSLPPPPPQIKLMILMKKKNSPKISTKKLIKRISKIKIYKKKKYG